MFSVTNSGKILCKNIKLNTCEPPSLENNNTKLLVINMYLVFRFKGNFIEAFLIA